jgi:precorrin-8X/cobalt-precorrin-8 methylmutase
MEYAERNILTRSSAGIELLKDKIEGSVIAIRNATTSLIQLLSIIKSTGIRPTCVVGVPVGFVDAAESKELLMAADLPLITTKDNRGGNPIAVAIINALICL